MLRTIYLRAGVNDARVFMGEHGVIGAILLT